MRVCLTLVSGLWASLAVAKEESMPNVKVNNITINYDQQGTGEPLILIPYLTADCRLLRLPRGQVRQPR